MAEAATAVRTAASPMGAALMFRADARRTPLVVRWFMPNLAAMLASAALIYCLFIFGGGERLFRDSDSGWHIRNGESILEQRSLPRTDPYSFSKANQPW